MKNGGLGKAKLPVWRWSIFKPTGLTEGRGSVSFWEKLISRAESSVKCNLCMATEAPLIPLLRGDGVATQMTRCPAGSYVSGLKCTSKRSRLRLVSTCSDGSIRDCDWSTLDVCHVDSLFLSTMKKIFEGEVGEAGPLTFENSQSALPVQL